MRPLNLDQVNAWVLRKQHLAGDRASKGIPHIVDGIGGLHATAPTTPHLSLHSRCPGFERENLEHELYGLRSDPGSSGPATTGPRLARLRCVRKTVYVLTEEMMPVYYSATTSAVTALTWRYMENRGVSPEAYAELSGEILRLLQGRDMDVKRLRKALGTELDVSAVVNLMCDQGLLLRWRPVKTWRSRVQTYARFADVFPSVDLLVIGQEEATVWLVSHYLRAFGPASETDIVWWTGLGKTRIRSALRQLADSTVRVHVDGIDDELILHRSELDGLQKAGPVGAPAVHLLPFLDHYLMGYIDRLRYLDPEHRESVFDRSGNATSTVLVDGRVVGTWDYEEPDGPLVKLHFLQRLDPGLKERIRHRAAEMGEFLAGGPARICDCPTMVPLSQRTAGSFMSPLKGQTSEV